jgi:hypothetical protein
MWVRWACDASSISDLEQHEGLRTGTVKNINFYGIIICWLFYYAVSTLKVIVCQMRYDGASIRVWLHVKC